MTTRTHRCGWSHHVSEWLTAQVIVSHVSSLGDLLLVVSLHAADPLVICDVAIQNVPVEIASFPGKNADFQ